MHGVYAVRCIACCGEVDNAAEDSGLIDEANLLTVDVDKGSLRFRWNTVSFVEVGEPWDDPGGWIALRVEWVCRSQHCIRRYDCLAVVVVAWVILRQSITSRRRTL